MFERFTEQARQVIVLAQEEGRLLRHNYIGTEHMLLGVLREEEGLAARVLESLDITVERVRDEVVRLVGAGEEEAAGQIPFTPRAKKVLELAQRESLSLGHNYIGTEHLLLGILRENDGVAVHVLRDLDAEPDRLREEVNRMVAAPGTHLPPEPADLPLTGRARKLLAAAQREAREAGDERVGTRHILLALGRESGGSFRNLDADAEEIAAELRRLIGPGPAP